MNLPWINAKLRAFAEADDAQDLGPILVGAKVHRSLIAKVDRLVARLDTDRSKFIRAALKEKIARTLQPAGKGAR